MGLESRFGRNRPQKTSNPWYWLTQREEHKSHHYIPISSSCSTTNIIINICPSPYNRGITYTTSKNIFYKLF
uniref:Ovule protein n=1 Tax=Meloidogyne incognita TaxID=6306 RepID=A0A914KKG6_MELIC